MNKKHLVMALTLVMAGTLLTVLAQNDFVKMPAVEWMANPVQTIKNMSLSAPTLSAPVHDAQYPTSGTFNNILSNAVVSKHQDGDMVVVMTAKGELPGTLTLKLQRDAAGTNVTGGEWAFLVSYTKEVHNEDGTHGESLVQRGTVKGTISGGQVTLDGNESISSVNSVQLVLNGGTLTFHKTTTGNGTGQATNILDNATSTGTLNLTF
jgi:hypothetical protein